MVDKEYIIQQALKNTTFKACIKQSVYCLILTKDGKEFFGSNEMKNKNISICPRVEMKLPTGVGYHHCLETCKQESHAEIQAIQRAKKANANLDNSTLYLVGHTYCCDNCILEMKKAGVKNVVIFDTGENKKTKLKLSFSYSLL